MKDFAAIDFETANNERSSVCSVGVVIYRGGMKVDEFYSLIKPEPEYYNYWCTQVHGLSSEDTDDAPIFPDVWKQIEPKIAGLPLIAHNKAFDESCLKAVFRVYQMDSLITSSTAHVLLLARFGQKVPITSTSLPHVADISWRTIITLWQMQKHVLPLPYRYYKIRNDSLYSAI